MKKIFGSRGNLILLITAFLLLITGSAMGAGFALVEQSVGGLGNAYAGGAASAEDASTIFFNPAGMARLGGQELVLGAHIIMPSAKFNNEGSTHMLQAKTTVPLLGDNGGDGGVTKLLPNLYYSRKINDRLTAGIGINSPFGLATDYNNTWVGRYHAITSDMLTVNINPSLSYRINENLSIGGGVNIQYIKAKLSSAIDFGSLDAAGAFYSTLGLKPGALKLVPQMSDGLSAVEGDSWGVGANLGMLFEFNPNTRMGLAYRSSIKQTLKGDATFSNVPGGLTPYPVFKNSGVTAEIKLPDTLSASIYHQINPQWAVMADVTWTNWSVMNELRVKFDNTYQPDSVTSMEWKDSMRYSVGLTYTPNTKWTYRAGIAYDETPIPDSEHRTPRIPDGNRIWTACGVGYKISEKVTLNLGYAHLFIQDPKIDKQLAGDDISRGGLKGTYDAHVNILSGQLNFAL